MLKFMTALTPGAIERLLPGEQCKKDTSVFDHFETFF